MIDLFLAYLQTEDLSPGTLSTYRANLRLFGQWLTDIGRFEASSKAIGLMGNYPPLSSNKLSPLKNFTLLDFCQYIGVTKAVKMTSYKYT